MGVYIQTKTSNKKNYNGANLIVICPFESSILQVRISGQDKKKEDRSIDWWTGIPTRSTFCF